MTIIEMLAIFFDTFARNMKIIVNKKVLVVSYLINLNLIHAG